MSAVSPMSGCPTFDTDKKKTKKKKNRNEPNLKLRYPTGRRSNNLAALNEKHKVLRTWEMNNSVQ